MWFQAFVLCCRIKGAYLLPPCWFLAVWYWRWFHFLPTFIFIGSSAEWQGGNREQHMTTPLLLEMFMGWWHCFVAVLVALHICAVLALAGIHRDGEGKEGSVFYLFLRDTLCWYSYKYLICQWTCGRLHGVSCTLDLLPYVMCLMHASFTHVLCVSICTKASKGISHEAPVPEGASCWTGSWVWGRWC